MPQLDPVSGTHASNSDIRLRCLARRFAGTPDDLDVTGDECERKSEDDRRSVSTVYFSCPKFTVLLVLKGAVIVKAAPIVKAFEGQTISALSAWAQTKFGGPIIAEKIS